MSAFRPVFRLPIRSSTASARAGWVVIICIQDVRADVAPAESELVLVFYVPHKTLEAGLVRCSPLDRGDPLISAAISPHLTISQKSFC